MGLEAGSPLLERSAMQWAKGCGNPAAELERIPAGCQQRVPTCPSTRCSARAVNILSTSSAVSLQWERVGGRGEHPVLRTSSTATYSQGGSARKRSSLLQAHELDTAQT